MSDMLGIAVFVLLLTGCGLVDQAQNMNQTPAAQNSTALNTTPVALPAQNAAINSTLEAQWALITKPEVEAVCLKLARDAVAGRGYSPSVVFGCTCQAQETGDVKAYDCTVSAMNGDNPINVVCAKADATCSSSSTFGDASYTFDQLQALAGG
jgi:hypothetical protein